MDKIISHQHDGVAVQGRIHSNRRQLRTKLTNFRTKAQILYGTLIIGVAAAN
jgi:hypothetical protein